MTQSSSSVIFTTSSRQSFSLSKSTQVESSVIFLTSQSYLLMWLTPGTNWVLHFQVFHLFGPPFQVLCFQFTAWRFQFRQGRRPVDACIRSRRAWRTGIVGKTSNVTEDGSASTSYLFSKLARNRMWFYNACCHHGMSRICSKHFIQNASTDFVPKLSRDQVSAACPVRVQICIFLIYAQHSMQW